MEGWVILGGLALLIVGVVVAQQWFEKKRTEAWAAFAQQTGFVVAEDLGELNAAVTHFKLFNQGRSRQLKNAIRGSKDSAAVALFDYRYVTGSGKSSTTHRQTVAVVRSPNLSLPHFFVRRQMALLDLVGKLFGGQDLNFDDDPVFSKAFVLQSDGFEEEVRRLFNRSVREAFVALGPKGIQVEARGDLVLLHWGRRLGLERVGELRDDAVNLARTLMSVR